MWSVYILHKVAVRSGARANRTDKPELIEGNDKQTESSSECSVESNLESSTNSKGNDKEVIVSLT